MRRVVAGMAMMAALVAGLASADAQTRTEASPPMTVAAAPLMGRWSFEWDGASGTYTGTMMVDRSLGGDAYHGLVTVRRANGTTLTEEATITVRDGSLTVKCYNASESGWSPDNFFLAVDGARLVGYSLDNAGNRGKRIVLWR